MTLCLSPATRSSARSMLWRKSTIFPASSGVGTLYPLMGISFSRRNRRFLAYSWVKSLKHFSLSQSTTSYVEYLPDLTSPRKWSRAYWGYFLPDFLLSTKLNKGSAPTHPLVWSRFNPTISTWVYSFGMVELMYHSQPHLRYLCVGRLPSVTLDLQTLHLAHEYVR